MLNELFTIEDMRDYYNPVRYNMTLQILETLRSNSDNYEIEQTISDYITGNSKTLTRDELPSIYENMLFEYMAYTYIPAELGMIVISDTETDMRLTLGLCIIMTVSRGVDQIAIGQLLDMLSGDDVSAMDRVATAVTEYVPGYMPTDIYATMETVPEVSVIAITDKLSDIISRTYPVDDVVEIVRRLTQVSSTLIHTQMARYLLGEELSPKTLQYGLSLAEAWRESPDMTDAVIGVELAVLMLLTNTALTDALDIVDSIYENRNTAAIAMVIRKYLPNDSALERT